MDRAGLPTGPVARSAPVLPEVLAAPGLQPNGLAAPEIVRSHFTVCRTEAQGRGSLLGPTCCWRHEAVSWRARCRGSLFTLTVLHVVVSRGPRRRGWARVSPYPPLRVLLGFPGRTASRQTGVRVKAWQPLGGGARGAALRTWVTGVMRFPGIP